jgi:hypothetical protein
MSFDAKDLIRVLKACRQVGVTELKIGNVEVKFAPGEAVETSKRASEIAVVSETELKEAAENVNLDNNVVEAEERLDLLQIDDPSLYERLVIERELEDRGKPSEVTLN